MPEPIPDPVPRLPGYTIKTYRYLRLAMVTMLVLLAAGVLIERVNNPADCFQPSISDWHRAHTIGMLVALAVLLGGFGWFHWGRESFIDNAHYAAALPLFVAIILVAVINARQFTQERTGAMAARDVASNRYFVVAALLVVLPVFEWVVSKMVDTNHLVLWVEVTVLVLFAVFWLLQTEELWSEGVREPSAADS